MKEAILLAFLLSGLASALQIKGILGPYTESAPAKPAGSRIAFVVSESRVPPQDRPADLEFHSIEQRLDAGFFDPRAAPLVRAIEGLRASVFDIPNVVFRRAINYEGESGDCMLVEWSFSSHFGTGILLLDDTPVLTRYFFRFPDLVVDTRLAIDQLLTRLFVWVKEPLWLPSLQIVLEQDSGRVSRFYGERPFSVRSPGFYDIIQVAGAGTQAGTFVSVTLGKVFSPSDPVPPYVAERVPPLTERVTAWNFEKILSELGKKPIGGIMADLEFNRDQILLTELARRGMTQQEFVALVGGPGAEHPVALAERIRNILIAFSQLGKEFPLSRFFGPAMEFYNAAGPPAAGAVEQLFGATLKPCHPEFEDRAIEIFDEGVFQGGPLNYLSMCSSSQRAIESIERYSGRRLAADKEKALVRIRARRAGGALK